MKLDLSPDQEILRDATRRFLEQELPVERLKVVDGSPAELPGAAWRQAAELGWTSLLVEEADGGGSISGRPLADAAIVAEELGRAAAPGPFLPVNLVAHAVSRWGTDEHRGTVLPGLLDGTLVAAWAHGEAFNRWDPSRMATRAVADGGDLVVTGAKDYVEAAPDASWLLVTAADPDGAPCLLLVPRDGSGITVTEAHTIDRSRSFGQVRLDAVRVPASARLRPGGSDAVWELAGIAVALQCADTVGATDRAFRSTVEYTLQRQAFGRPIGSYQALKHRLADMLLWVELSKATTEAAIDAIDDGAPDASRLASVAKAYVAQHASPVMSDCQQLWGGISQTWEHDLHLFMRRVAVDRALFGTPEMHRDRIYSLLRAEGALRHAS